MVGSEPDPLLCLRTAASASGNDPLKNIKMINSDQQNVDTMEQADSIVFLHVDAASMQPSAEAAELIFPKNISTRMLRTRDSSKGVDVPKEDAFFPLSALVFALQQRDERAGAYLRNATLAQVVPVSALERQGVVDYLLGKKDTWEGIFDLASATSTTADTTPTTTTPAKRTFVPDSADVEYVRRLQSKYEVVLQGRNDALRGTHAPEDFAKATVDAFGVRAVFGPRLESAKRRASAPGKVAPAPPKAPPNAARRTRAQDPIILLSNSPTALVNIFNVKALLQDGVFVPPEEARQQAGGVPELVVTIQTQTSDEKVTARGAPLSRRILVVDSAEAVNRLGTGAPGSEQDPWNRVIAVFTTGQAWQFKSYRWSDPRELFKNSTLQYIQTFTQQWVCMFAGATTPQTLKYVTGT